MTPGARRAKCRRLQVAVAEMLAREFQLTILASKPTKPGIRNGATWVPEGMPADLLVRQSGQPGSDVSLLTDKAMRAVAYKGIPLYIECKNNESWNLGKDFWKGKTPYLVKDATEQLAKANIHHYHPLLILGKNNFPPIAVVAWWSIPQTFAGPLLMLDTFRVLPLYNLLQTLKGP